MALFLACVLAFSLFAGMTVSASGASLSSETGGVGSKWDLGGITLRVFPTDHFPNPETADEAQREELRERRANVEEFFNVTLDFGALAGVQYNDVPTVIAQSVAAKTHVVDVGNVNTYYMSQLVNAGALVDISDYARANIPDLYWKNVGELGGKVYAFSDSIPKGFQAIKFNRELIEAAGMRLDPGEMFRAGRWSFDDFMKYCQELRSKLPSDVNVIGMHPMHWLRLTTYSNGTYIIDPSTYIPNYTSDDFMESLNFFRDLIDEGVWQAPTYTAAEDGTQLANYDSTGGGFGEGKVVMTLGQTWEFDAHNEAGMNWGIVPPPWGPNATLRTRGNYTTLSDEYSGYYKDATSLQGIFIGAKDKITPEQWHMMCLMYQGEDSIASYEEVVDLTARGRTPDLSDPQAITWFQTELDMELWNWYVSRSTPFESQNFVGDWLTFYETINKSISTTQDPRAVWEAYLPSDLHRISENGFINPDNLPADMRAIYDSFTPAETE
jgi:maltose-binding protein MalE